MPSKGISCYSYICVPGCQIEFSAPKASSLKSDLNVWGSVLLEVDKKNISGLFNFVGRFTFKVTRNGATITSQWVDIDSMTGNLAGGTMKSMVDQVSYLSGDIIVTYMFYDAGAGTAGLPNTDQCYVIVSPNNGNWMGQAAPPGTDQAKKPFSRFVLPAAHDMGMNSMQTSEAVLQHAGRPFINVLKEHSNAFTKLGDNVSEAVIISIAPNIIQGLAITQKDNLETVLEIGARYFEFRPAHLHSAVRSLNPVPDKLYFQHGPIPGMAYDQFLHDIVTFLASHPEEIVVVQLRWDGVPAECAHPSDQELADVLNGALGVSNGSVIAGGLDDFQHLSTEELRAQRKRLILIQNVGTYSTYTDAGNATLNGDSIIAEFGQLSTDKQSGQAFTNIQCQATATNITAVVVYSALASNASNSCLLATKSICDNKTLPWIRQNALNKLKAEQLLTIMNDFFDGATADVGIQLSKTRLSS